MIIMHGSGSLFIFGEREGLGEWVGRWVLWHRWLALGGFVMCVFVGSRAIFCSCREDTMKASQACRYD